MGSARGCRTRGAETERPFEGTAQASQGEKQELARWVDTALRGSGLASRRLKTGLPGILIGDSGEGPDSEGFSSMSSRRPP
jgi:hypothetical protein